MSLILDALKKSEQSRVHSADPLWTSPTPSRVQSSIPRWAWVLIALLVLNIVILLAVIRLRPPLPALEATQVADEANPTFEGTSMAPSTIAATATVAGTGSGTTTISRGAPTGSASSPNRTDRVSRSSPPSLDDVPSRDNLLAQGAMIPAVKLTLHVFDTAPTSRFILLDGERLSEGDISRTGLKVTAIKAEGVVFSFGDYTFKVSVQ